VVPVGYSSTDSVAVGRGAVWAIGGTGITRIDPMRNAPVITIPVAQSITGYGPSPIAIAVNDTGVWVASRFIVGNAFRQAKESGSVSRIDPRTNAVVARITVGHDPFAIAATDDAIWVANRTDSTISRIDPHTNQVVKTIKLGGTPEGIAADDKAVWVSVG
jgi:YVTN family beta-propeller protein